ncbi:MAG TPA: response regulator transcription factor [Kofleriaceae bacterium]|nr:response regulator transcription factor [Kofleriaceae bacterium]
MRILVVEDELGLREGLCDLLAGDGHEVGVAADGEQGLALGTAEPFDLVVLDLMLPRLDGIEVCRRLRAARPGMPILILTARGGEDDVVRGLGEGADDYVTKPFGARELLARVRALARRAPPRAPEMLAVDGLLVDLGLLVARRGAAEIALTAREAGVLRLLYRHRGRPVSRAELLEQVWGARGDLRTRAVDMAIAVLRKKIERDPASPRIVVSVKGVGYAWGEPRAPRQGGAEDEDGGAR